MLPHNITTKVLWDNRRAWAAWALDTALVAALYSSLYSTISDGALEHTFDNFPKALRQAFNMDDLSSAAGYLGSSPFGIIVPLAVLFFGIVTGTKAIAGDEESGLLDLLIAHPVTRVRLVLQRCAALAIGTFGIAGLVFLVMLAVRGPADLGSVSTGEFAAQCLNLALLGLLAGALAVAIGGFIGQRAMVLGTASGLGVLSYVINAFAEQVNGLGWTRYLSPFHYYIGGEPLRNGFQWADSGILLATSVILVSMGVYRFNQRDIGV